MYRTNHVQIKFLGDERLKCIKIFLAVKSLEAEVHETGDILVTHFIIKLLFKKSHSKKYNTRIKQQ